MPEELSDEEEELGWATEEATLAQDEDSSSDSSIGGVRAASQRRLLVLASLDKLEQAFRQKQQQERRVDKCTKRDHLQRQQEGAPLEAATRTGTLKKLVERKGFGFIAPDDGVGGDVFLHCSDITGGGFADLACGVRLRFDGEVDPRSGKTRARKAAILGRWAHGRHGLSEIAENQVARTEGEAAMEARNATSKRELRSRSADLGTLVNLPGGAARDSSRYSRGELLACSSVLGDMPGPMSLVHGLGILTVLVPQTGDYNCDCGEDPRLDDESLIVRMEARLDEESGADAKNRETFGDCSGGWTFEEALAANSALHASGRTRVQKQTEESGPCPSTTAGSAAVSPGATSQCGSPTGGSSALEDLEELQTTTAELCYQ